MGFFHRSVDNDPYEMKGALESPSSFGDERVDESGPCHQLQDELKFLGTRKHSLLIIRSYICCSQMLHHRPSVKRDSILKLKNSLKDATSHNLEHYPLVDALILYFINAFAFV